MSQRKLILAVIVGLLLAALVLALRRRSYCAEALGRLSPCENDWRRIWIGK